MKVPKEVVDKMREVNRMNNEIVSWIVDHLDTDGMLFEDYFWEIVPEPYGEPIDERKEEYTDQCQVGENWYIGDYYMKTYDGYFLKLPYES